MERYRQNCILSNILFTLLSCLFPHHQLDPYIKIKLGVQELSDKENYITNSLNPQFGCMFELPATLPIDHTLTISVMDYNPTSADDLIGETKIDLENRYLSQHHPLCGLPETFAE